MQDFTYERLNLEDRRMTGDIHFDLMTIWLHCDCCLYQRNMKDARYMFVTRIHICFILVANGVPFWFKFYSA